MRMLLYSMMLWLMPANLVAATLSLDDCLARARNHNPALRVARKDVGIAHESIRQTDAALFPRVDAQGGYTAQLEAQAMKVAGQVMETQQPAYLFASLGINYTLYDFGRREARRSSSRLNLDAITFGLRNQEQEVSLQVVESYFGILETQRNITAATEELQTVEEHRRVAQALYDAGSVTRNDLLQAEVRLANARQQLLARRNLLENQYLILGFLTGIPAAEHPQLAEPAPLVQPHTAPDRSKAIRQRPDLLALRKVVEMSEQGVRESQSAFYPELFSRLSLDYLENNKLREQTIYGATVGIKINLFDGFASTATRSKSVAAQSRATEQLRLAEEQAQLEVATSANDLQVAFERIAVTKESIRQGEENLRINQNRYKERVGTATEVLDAQTLLTQARTEHYRALYDYQRAAARLRKATGDL